MKSIKVFALASVAALVMAGCGGDGGGDTPQLALSQLQGYWTGPATGTAVGGASKVRAVVLEDGSAWLFLHDGSQGSEPLLGLATATLFTTQQSFTGTGKRYPTSGVSAADITVTGGAPVGTAFTINVASGNATSALTLAKDTAYDTPATQASVVGVWSFTKAGGTITAEWTVSSTGDLTGSTSLGCTYLGTVRPRNTTTAVYAVAIAETCGTTVKQLTGIGKLNSAKTFLTFGLTTTGGAEAEAFAAQKQ